MVTVVQEASGVLTCSDMASWALCCSCCSCCCWHPRPCRSAAVTKTISKSGAAAVDATPSASDVIFATSWRVSPRDPGQGSHSHCRRKPPQLLPLNLGAAMPPSPSKMIGSCRPWRESPSGPPSGLDPEKLPSPSVRTSIASPNGIRC
ncbi:hypothetical protein Vretimale_644 [Volvox reticuliferus]|uniref:Uncharacterized protein n=1 Tax=Volvox reticuliferus TaxID=1737510 RepID=A0A8J4G195_9CHLO|nr:hypothetical protein Vretimale_644 [Volvox reticuliferus]